VLLVVVVLVGIGTADFLIGRVVHDQHQRHLVAALAAPSPHPKDGDPVLLMQIPAIDFNEVVVKGSDASELRGGPGLVDSGSIPGRRGTSVILGHRYRYGGPFNRLHTLQPGAEALVVQSNKIIVRYTVTKVKRVAVGGRPLSSPRTDHLLLVTDASGLWPGKVLVVTLTPERPPTVGRTPGTGVRLAEGTSGAGLLVVVALVVAAIAALGVAATRLRRLYRPGTVLAALLPLAGLAVIVVVMSLDLALSAAY
jgi:LPXTG-site transpeptidase (sortase) family protein